MPPRISSTLGDISSDPSALGHMAFDASMEGHNEDAVTLIRAHINHFPEDRDAFLLLGDCLVSVGRHMEALEAYHRFESGGGDAETATDRCVRAVGLFSKGMADAPLFDWNALCSETVSLVKGLPRSRVKAASVRACEEWNSIRTSSDLRLATLRKRYLSGGDRVDLQFLIMPMLMFQAGYPPSGVGALMKHLKGEGFRSGVVDYNLDLWDTVDVRWQNHWTAPYSDHWRRRNLWLTGFGIALRNELRALAEILAELNTETIGLPCFRVNRQAVTEIIPILRRSLRSDQRILLGGPDLSESYLCLGRCGGVLDIVDACIVGEGEKSLTEVLRAWQNGDDVTAIPGVLTSGSRDSFEKTTLINRRELAGFPDFDREYIQRIPKPRTQVIVPSRGCPQRCDFCSDHLTWGTHRLREAEDVVEEIRHSVENHGVTSFFFADSATNIKIEFLETLCDLIIAEDWGLEIVTSMMVSNKMTPALCDKMRQAGFRALYTGVETGSPSVLKAMGKHGTVEEAARNLRLFHEAGMANKIFLLVGHPSEGVREFEQTVEFVRANHQCIDVIDMVYPCYIIRNTALWKRMVERGAQMPDGWGKWSAWAEGENDIAERLRRQRRLIDVAAELSIPIGLYMDTPNGNGNGAVVNLLGKPLDLLRRMKRWLLRTSHP